MNKFSSLFDNTHVPFDFQPVDKCVIVGNGGVLLNSELGGFIDSHDCVVRMNAAQIEGYENDVGSKTTFRIINGTLLKGHSVKVASKTNDWYIRTLTGENIIIGRTTREGRKTGVLNMLNKNDLYFPSSSAQTGVRHYEKKYNLRLASTGLFTILFFLEFFETVSVVGFGFHTEDLKIRHYWESYTSEHHVNHSWDKEKKIVSHLREIESINVKTGEN